MVTFSRISPTPIQRNLLALKDEVEFPDYDLHLYFDDDPTSVQHGTLILVPYHAGTLTALDQKTSLIIFFDAHKVVEQMDILGRPIDAVARHQVQTAFGRALEEEKRRPHVRMPRGYMKRCTVHDSKDAFLKMTEIYRMPDPESVHAAQSIAIYKAVTGNTESQWCREKPEVWSKYNKAAIDCMAVERNIQSSNKSDVSSIKDMN